MSSTDSSNQITDLEEGQREIEKLSRAYTWNTSSQRLHISTYYVKCMQTILVIPASQIILLGYDYSGQLRTYHTTIVLI